MKMPAPFIPVREHSKITQQGEFQDMTIAAGFRCTDGVVLCTDSEIWFDPGTSKSYESKVLPVNTTRGVYLAYAGDTDSAKALADRIEGHIGRLKDKALLNKAKQIYENFWDKFHTRARKGAQVWAEFLITSQVGERLELYCARDGHFTKVRYGEYRTLGAGAEEARKLIQPFYESLGRELTTKVVSHAAIYALRLVKNAVRGCGGDTNLYEIPDRRDPRLDQLPCEWFTGAVKESEKDCEMFDSQMRPVLVSFLRGDKKELSARLKVMGKSLHTRLAKYPLY